MASLITFLIGGVLGVFMCNLLAVFAKPLNLGLGGNSLTGLLAGGGMAVIQRMIAPSPLSALFVSAITALVVMLAIGSYLNHRAR